MSSDTPYTSIVSYWTDRALSCYLGKVYLLSYKRNTFHGVFPYTAEQFRTLDAAKQAAQSQRKQGTRFIITELPAIVFVTQPILCLITGMYAFDPFKSVVGRLPTSPQISDIAECFDSSTTVQFSESRDVVLPILPFRRHYSRPGTRYDLTWVVEDCDTELQFAEAVVEHLQKWLRRSNRKRSSLNEPKAA